MTTPSFHIGPVPVYGRRILAPMDGFSDLPFRSLCRRFGSAMSYTSFVNAAGILAGSAQANAALAFEPLERPVAMQIFDDDEARLVRSEERRGGEGGRVELRGVFFRSRRRDPGRLSPGQCRAGFRTAGAAGGHADLRR